MYSYEDRLDMVVLEVFEKDTNNGYDMDWEDREVRIKDIRDAAANSYYEDMTNDEWVAETMRKLGH